MGGVRGGLTFVTKKVVIFLKASLTMCKSLQWVGPVEDMGAEFDKIDKNGGGQILFSEFVDWALEKDLDIEDDVEPDAE